MKKQLLPKMWVPHWDEYIYMWLEFYFINISSLSTEEQFFTVSLLVTVCLTLYLSVDKQDEIPITISGLPNFLFPMSCSEFHKYSTFVVSDYLCRLTTMVIINWNTLRNSSKNTIWQIQDEHKYGHICHVTLSNKVYLQILGHRLSLMDLVWTPKPDTPNPEEMVRLLLGFISFSNR